jgi:hypothetical protein
MRIVYGLGLLGAACLMACGSSSPKGGGPSGSGGDGSGGTENVAGNAGAGSHKAGSSNHGDAGDGSGGDAGSGDLPPVVSSAKPHTAGGLVAGGSVGHSAHFTGVFTLGAAPGGNGLTTSKSHQLRGGVIGASQK